VVGEELVVYAEVANHSRDDVETTAFSEVGESRRSQNLSLPAGETATAVFRHTLTEAGPVAIKVSLAEDAFPGDDRRSLAVTVRPYLRLGVVSGDDADTAKLWTRAAQSLRWAVPEWTTPAELGDGKAGEFDGLLLSGVSLPDDLEIPAETKVIALPAAGSEASREKSRGAPFLVSVAQPEDALFDLFRGGESGSVAGLAGDERIVWAEAEAEAEGEALLAFEDGKPALLRLSPNRYRWLMPLSERPGSFAGRVEFVPFFAELLLADRKTGAAAGGGIDFEPGETVFWEPAESLAPDTLELVNAGGEALEFSAGKGGRFSTGAVSAPGVLEWRANGQTVGFSSINFPVSESNLTTLTLEETQDSASVAVRGGGEVRHLRDGLKLWPWLLAAAIVFLMLESGVTLWSAKTP
jgi:hypothetical protein